MKVYNAKGELLTTITGTTTISAAQWAWLGGYEVNAQARAYLSADQTDIAHNTATKVLLNTESFDPGANFADYKFVAPVAGYYLIVGSILWSEVVADKLYITVIRKNGNDLSLMQGHSALASNINITAADILYLEATDYIELWAYHQAGVGTVDLGSGVYGTYLTVQFLSS